MQFCDRPSGHGIIGYEVSPSQTKEGAFNAEVRKGGNAEHDRHKSDGVDRGDAADRADCEPGSKVIPKKYHQRPMQDVDAEAPCSDPSQSEIDGCPSYGPHHDEQSDKRVPDVSLDFLLDASP